MNDVDPRVRDELRAIADEASTRPYLWDAVQRRIRVRQGRRRLSIGAVATAGVVAAVIVAVIVLGSPKKATVSVRPTIPQALTPAMPSRIAAVTDNHLLVLLDAQTGAELRTLATGVAQTSTVRLAVSPDGQTVWFEHKRPAGPDQCLGGGTEIVRTPVDQPEPVNALPGSDPVISPDGTLLAYTTRTDDACGRPNTVVVIRIADIGKPGPIDRVIPARVPTHTWTSWLSWAPDNRHLLVGMVEPDTSSYPRIVDTAVEKTLEDAPRLNASDATQSILVYRGAHGDLLGWSDQLPSQTSTAKGTYAAAIDPQTGQVTQRLFPVPGAILDPPQADATGDHILATVGAGLLYRWSVGEEQATRVGSGILAAVWVPDTHAAAPANTTVLPPTGNSTASLKATALAWAHAFLVGSLDDIKALQGPECADHSGTTVPIRTVNQYLRGERAVMTKYFGRPLDKIAFSTVAVRNVTSTTGDALVEYDLPAALVGNDNWVSYTIHAGRWKVSDCHAPIGGTSDSKSATVTVPTP